jgi:hypothetical protein
MLVSPRVWLTVGITQRIAAKPLDKILLNRTALLSLSFMAGLNLFGQGG